MNSKENLLLTFIDFLLKPFTNAFLRDIKSNDSVMEVISLYPENKFIPIRFWDAPFIEVEKLIPEDGFIVDLGCGEGVFTNFLGVSSRRREILGIEIDRNRLKVANKGVSNVSFKWGDATKVKLSNTDAIILFHVLHHLNSYSEQKKLISKCFNQLKGDGKLIIVEVEPGITFKYFVTWLTDHFIVPILFERRFYSPIYFRKSSEWLELIEKTGFNCRIVNVQRGHPFTHIILECQKK